MKPNAIQFTGFGIATIFIVALTIFPAIVDGQRRGRWGRDEQLEILAGRLENFPSKFGQWEATNQFEMDENSQNQLAPIAAIDRTYTHSAKGIAFQVFLLLGPTGPTAAHTPDICFDSRDQEQIGQRKKVDLVSGSRKFSLFESQFVSRGVDGMYLKTWYGWTVNGDWQAPERPRFTFADSLYLFKMQAVARYRTKEQMENDTEFEDFVKELENTLALQLF